MMRCVDGDDASKASHDAQGARRSPALPRENVPSVPVSFGASVPQSGTASARQRMGHPVFTSAGESVGHPPKSEPDPARTDPTHPLGSCRASPGWPALRAFPLAGIPACGHSRSRRAFMRSTRVSETCFGGDARLLDGRVQRWLHRCRWLPGIAPLGGDRSGANAGPQPRLKAAATQERRL